MKKLSKAAILLASVALVLGLVACPNKTEPKPEPEQNTVAKDFVKIQLKGKTFQMGAEYTGDYASYGSEKPIHQVAFTRDIYMCDHEVTQAEWETIMGNNPSHFQGEEEGKKVAEGETQANRPVEKVSWYDAIAYCNKRSIKEDLEPCYSVKVGGTEVDWANLSYSDIPTAKNDDWDAVTCDFTKTGYRLPTEAEWEYAARGGIADTDKPVWAGTTEVGADEANLKNYFWYTKNSDSRTHEVKKKSPNDYGLYDMSGNVWEWCWDWYGGYTAEAASDPSGPGSGAYRVSRGGGWHRGAVGCRASYAPRLADVPLRRLGAPPGSLRVSLPSFKGPLIVPLALLEPVGDRRNKARDTIRLGKNLVLKRYFSRAWS